MVDDCPMREDCPSYDRDARMCLVHPGDCEFSPVVAETALVLETSDVLAPDTSTDAMAG